MNKVLQKAIADSGYCSRRKAQQLVERGAVKINSRIAELGSRVSEKDEITVEGKKLPSKREPIYIKLNKPKDYVCTNRGFKNEKSIMELINTKQRVFVAGRLDKDSHGLVLLSNDGNWVYKLTHPSYEHEKEYEIELDKELKEEEENKLTKKGIDIGDKRKAYAKSVGKIERKRYKVVLTQGKKRQIRRMFKALNKRVLDLKRTRVDKYKIGNLREGKWHYL